AALVTFAGTIVFASHDRRLISRLATRLWLVEDGALREFAGNLEELERVEAATPQEAAPPVKRNQLPASATPSPRRRAEAVAALETQIEAHETSLAELGDEINRASADGETASLPGLGRRFDALKTELDELLHRWTELG
ncbi:MAG TPA: hypothetical protein VI876_09695, partial [Dehalococcoidia bacterium]|nr:hypothetical protein [Dehalococcoidia bacterium]